MLTTDSAILTTSRRTRARSEALSRQSSALLDQCQATRADINRARRTCSTRRLIHIAVGAVEGFEPDLIAIRTIRAKVARGTLRIDACVSGVAVVRGSRRPCCGCDRSIQSDDVEMRARYSDGEVLQFHQPCFLAWHRASRAATLRRLTGKDDDAVEPSDESNGESASTVHDPACTICGRVILPWDSVAFIAKTMAHIMCAFCSEP